MFRRNIAIAACTLISACSSDLTPSNDGVGKTDNIDQAEATKQNDAELQSKGVAAPAMPEQAEPTLIENGAPEFSVEAPPLRKATRDEIEELNGTYRTEGSRERLLRRIQAGVDTPVRTQLISLYRRVSGKLSAEERAAAEALLDATLQARGEQL